MVIRVGECVRKNTGEETTNAMDGSVIQGTANTEGRERERATKTKAQHIVPSMSVRGASVRYLLFLVAPLLRRLFRLTLSFFSIVVLDLLVWSAVRSLSFQAASAGRRHSN